MATFSVDTSALKSIAGKLATASSEYERIYKQLIQTASSLGAAYDSADNKKFVASIEGCCTALQAMANKLQLASEELTQASANYTSTEEYNTQQASRLGGH